MCTSISSCCPRAVRSAAKVRTPARLETSHISTPTSAPGTSAKTSRRTCSPRSRLSTVISTDAPSRAIPTLVAFPIPELAPVTSAVLPLKPYGVGIALRPAKSPNLVAETGVAGHHRAVESGIEQRGHGQPGGTSEQCASQRRVG